MEDLTFWIQKVIRKKYENTVTKLNVLTAHNDGKSEAFAVFRGICRTLRRALEQTDILQNMGITPIFEEPCFHIDACPNIIFAIGIKEISHNVQIVSGFNFWVRTSQGMVIISEGLRILEHYDEFVAIEENCDGTEVKLFESFQMYLDAFWERIRRIELMKNDKGPRITI